MDGRKACDVPRRISTAPLSSRVYCACERTRFKWSNIAVSASLLLAGGDVWVLVWRAGVCHVWIRGNAMWAMDFVIIV